jgi:thiosulfate dehydrogenase (quinone) large subunit
MATLEENRPTAGDTSADPVVATTPAAPAATTDVAGPDTRVRDRIWAATRISLGWVFLWAFLDKTFALGFATGRLEDGTVEVLGDAAWINGGSPTFGFLTFGTSGPLAPFFQTFAGAAWADWLFMIGLLGIGLALTLGIGMKIAAWSGAAMMVFMYLAALWPANNPFMDDHLVYALVLIGLVYANAGNTWGLGKTWSRLDLVQRFPILR